MLVPRLPRPSCWFAVSMPYKQTYSMIHTIHYTILYYTIPYYIILYYTILYYTTLHCTTLYYYTIL